MANRTLIGAFEGTYVLRASRPGLNVLNGALNAKQLSFDSRWGNVGQLHMEGSFSSAVVGGWGAIPPAFQTTVMFGATFTQAPMVLIWFYASEYDNRQANNISGESSYSGLSTGWSINIQADRFVFARRVERSVADGSNATRGAIGGSTRTAFYRVYRPVVT